MRDRVFVTRTKPEVAIVSWSLRVSPATGLIRDDPAMACDLCNKRLDWEPFPVIDLPSRDELQDPDYVPVGGNALCRACARKFYHLTKKDACKVNRVWFCHDCARHRIR
jgi:hypothetical protein